MVVKVRKRPELWLGTASLLVLTLAIPGQSLAQSAPKEKVLKQAKGQIEQVVVTANRRKQLAERVSASLTALSGTALANSNIKSERDLQQYVPGLTVNAGETGEESSYSLRGQSTDMFSGSASGVATYTDEIAMPPNTEGPSNWYDMASIQVLKGPQGTLFGRNAIGGAILYTTAPPTNRYGGYVSVRFGNFSTTEVQFAANLPVISDKLDVRVAGDFDKFDGYVKNVNIGGSHGNQDNKSARISVAYMPTTHLKTTLVFQYNQEAGTSFTDILYSVNGYSTNGQLSGLVCPKNAGYQLNCTSELVGLLLPGPYRIDQAAFLKKQQAAGYYKSFLPVLPTQGSHSIMVSDITSYDLSPNIELRNIAGYFAGVFQSGNSLDGTSTLYVADVNPYTCWPTGFLPYTGPQECGGNHFNQQQWSEELQLQGHVPNSATHWIVGLYASSNQQNYRYPGTFGLPPTSLYWYVYGTRDNSYAVYGQGTYDLSKWTGIKGLSIVGGVRETWERVSETTYPGYTFAPGPLPAGYSNNESNPSWQGGLNWQVNSNLLLYFVSRGSWRAGGYTDSAPPGVFQPETTHDFEVGAKFNGRVEHMPAQFNLALYQQVSNNAQHDFYVFPPGGQPASFTVNVPEAKVEGLEVDGEARPVSWLTLGGSAAFTNASFPQNMPATPVPGATGVPLINYPFSPLWSDRAFADVTLPIPERFGGLVYHVDAYSQSGEYFSAYNATIEPGTHIPGYALVNMRLDWMGALGTNTTVSLYVKNVADRGYLAGGMAVGAALGDNFVLPGEPRTYGITLRYDF